MNSGINVNDPTVVAAFKTALLHQGIIALLIFALMVTYLTGLWFAGALPFFLLFGALGAAAWYAARRLRHGRRQPAQPSLPA